MTDRSVMPDYAAAILRSTCEAATAAIAERGRLDDQEIRSFIGGVADCFDADPSDVLLALGLDDLDETRNRPRLGGGHACCGCGGGCDSGVHGARHHRRAAHRPELAARLADFHISFSIGGRVVSQTVKNTTMNAAYARMDMLIEQAEDEANFGRLRHLAPLCAYNCQVRQIERIDPTVRAQMAMARAAGATRRACGLE